jgi:hypothetical protein
MTTIRSYLNRKIRRVYTLAILFWILIGLFAIIVSDFKQYSESTSHYSHFLPLIPFIGFFGCAVYLMLAIRCPRCYKPVGSLASLDVLQQSLLGPAISKRVKFCPFCGVNLDVSLEELASMVPPGGF